MVNEQVTTIELTAGTPSTVEFSGAYPYYWVDNRSAGDVYASLGTPEAGADGTYTIAAGSQLRISGGAFNTKLSLLGNGKVQVIASGIASCPFKGAQGGGDYAVAGAASYTLNNAVDYPLLGLNLYGKSTQDGVPTPEAPVDIVSVGDSGSIEVQTCGKNLFYLKKGNTSNGITGEVVDSNTLHISGTATTNWADVSGKYTNNVTSIELGKKYIFSIDKPLNYQVCLKIYDDINQVEKFYMAPGKTSIVFQPTIGKNNLDVFIGLLSEGMVIDDVVKFQLEIGDTATEYEPYKGSTSTITSALPLCGIPVDNYGNYTDSNGQQWICDELIYNADGTGKIIKNIRKYTFTGTDEGGYWLLNSTVDNTKKRFQFKITDENIKPVYDSGKFTARSPSIAICDKYSVVTNQNTYELINGVSFSHSTGGYFAIYDENYSTISSINEWKSHLAENPVTVIYQLNKPQEIELTAAEIAVLRELQTFDGVSNVSNDSGADMSVKYCTNKALSEFVYPITMGLQAQIDELKAAVISLGGNV